MKTLTLLILLIIISEVALAQRRPYNNPIVLEERDFLFPSMPPVYIAGYKFRIDTIRSSKFHRAGVTGKFLRPHLQHDPDASKYLKKYERTRRAGWIQAAAMYALIFSAIAVGIDQPDPLPKYFPIALITSGGLYISATITYSFIAPPKLRQAVTIANRNHRKKNR